MHKKIKKVACVLAAGLIATGTVGMLSACGNNDQATDDKKQEITQPLDPEPENVNEVEEFLTVAKNVTDAINNVGKTATQPAAATFRIMPMAMASDLNQTLLADLGKAADTDALTQDTANVQDSMQGDTVMVNIAHACAYLVNQRGETKLYGKILSMPVSGQYFRVTKVGKVWTVEEYMERTAKDAYEGSPAGTPINYYRFEIEYQDAGNFKMQYFFKGYNTDSNQWFDELSYAYVDAEQNFCKFYALGDVYQYGVQKDGEFVGWQIDSETVVKSCQDKIVATFPVVEPKDLSAENIDYTFTDEECEQAFAAIMGGGSSN